MALTKADNLNVNSPLTAGNYIPMPNTEFYSQEEKNKIMSNSAPYNPSPLFNPKPKDDKEDIPKFSGNDFYYGPLPVYKNTADNQVPVKVILKDELWMETPKEENFQKLVTLLNKELNKKRTATVDQQSLYYDPAIVNNEEKINFLRNKIIVMGENLQKPLEEVDKVLGNGIPSLEQGVNPQIVQQIGQKP